MEKSSKEWQVVYNWTETGIEYLNQQEYERLMAGISQGLKLIDIDGRVFNPDRIALIRQNPQFVNPTEVERIKKIVKERREAKMKTL